MASLQDANSPVALRATNCALLFNQLTSLSEHIDQVSKSQALDEFSRFKLWAGNIGALHPFSIKTSLDFRLRENSRVSKRITDLLDELAESLEEAYSLTSGITEGHSAESALADEDELVFDEDNEGLSEISEIFKAISDVIANLFRISSVIRNNVSRDRYAKAIASAALRFPVDDYYDITHVELKFPALKSTGKDWLAIRLGKAITQRRKYLWYCREHHDKTTQDMPTYNLGRKLAVDGKSARSKHPSTLAQTQASTLLPANDALLSRDYPDEENCSQLSYVTSTIEGPGGHKLSVVPSQHTKTLGGSFDTQLPQVMEMCQRSLSHKIRPECPICENWEQAIREQNPQFSQAKAFYITPKQYKSHIGAHMEQLALFAIPRGAADDGRSQSHGSLGENYQTGSLQSLGEWHSKSPSNTSTDNRQEKKAWNENERIDDRADDFAAALESATSPNHESPEPSISQDALDELIPGEIDRSESNLEEGAALKNKDSGKGIAPLQSAQSLHSVGVHHIQSASFNFAAPRLATSAPIYPCTFAFSGCTSVFNSKSDWKRHVASEHGIFSFWKCTLDSCAASGQSGRFNSKDLFDEHLRQMHSPSDVLSMAKEEWKSTFDWLVGEDSLEGRRSIREIGCPIPSCDVRWEGVKLWEEMVKHVGHHLEEEGDEDWSDKGSALLVWAFREGIVGR
ncbi:hypothetical protein V497_04637 [Pseudogymnoascus sp. VKM F-4516 (FW-969)]|nr:hypothetical protein V497_04637 [Pseudogymnoascus sp. VKM F-4516 (FW-969)]